jgi:hypothetical protein
MEAEMMWTIFEPGPRGNEAVLIIDLLIATSAEAIILIVITVFRNVKPWFRMKNVNVLVTTYCLHLQDKKR